MATDLEDLREGRVPRTMIGVRPVPSVERPQATGAAAVAQPAKEKTAPLVPADAGQPTMVRGSTSLTAVHPTAKFWKRRAVRVAAVASLVFFILLAVVLYRAGQRGRVGAFATSYLRFSCLHDFRGAEFTVWVDGTVYLVGRLGGRRREYNQSVRVPAGDRSIRVRVVSPQDGYDQMTKIEGELPGGAERTLRVVAYRGEVMRMEWITAQ
jgi:hypothetical protein